MGRLLVALAREDARLRVAGAVGAAGHAAIGRDAGEVAGGAPLGVRVGDALAAVCRSEQVVLDFTAPAATLAQARVAAERGAGLVIGTTGLDGEQQRELAALAARTRTVFAPNMSVGVTVLTELVSLAARLLDASFEAEVVELHHHANKDAPSGPSRKARRRVIAGGYGEEEQRRAAGCIGRPATGGDSFTASGARGGDRPPRRGLPPPAARGAAAPGRHERRLPALLARARRSSRGARRRGRAPLRARRRAPPRARPLPLAGA